MTNTLWWLLIIVAALAVLWYAFGRETRAGARTEARPRIGAPDDARGEAPPAVPGDTPTMAPGDTPDGGMRTAVREDVRRRDTPEPPTRR